MAYAKARRHYRVAENDVKNEMKNGIFIPENKKIKILIITVSIIFLIFFKGILLGYLFGKNSD